MASARSRCGFDTFLDPADAAVSTVNGNSLHTRFGIMVNRLSAAQNSSRKTSVRDCQFHLPLAQWNQWNTD